MAKNSDLDKKDEQMTTGPKKEANENLFKPKCRVCGKYTDKKTMPQCFGHGGKDGGGDDDADEELASDEYTSDLEDSVKEAQEKSAMTHDLTPDSTLEDSEFAPELDEEQFNPDIISELLAKEFLLIDNDKENGRLTIKLLTYPEALSKEETLELRKFVNAIQNELEIFKKENNLSDNFKSLEQDNKGNFLSLRITFPKPTLYDAFMKQLAGKNLLPVQVVNQQANEKVTYEAGKNHFNPTPLSMKPEPSASRNRKDEDAKNEKENAHQEDRSSTHAKSPFDISGGPKPNGCK